MIYFYYCIYLFGGFEIIPYLCIKVVDLSTLTVSEYLSYTETIKQNILRPTATTVFHQLARSSLLKASRLRPAFYFF